MGRGIGGHARPVRGATDVWLTPPEIIHALGGFDLDPCGAPPPRPWSTANRIYALPEEDGLALPWTGRVWLNPPYSDVERWLERLADHGRGTAICFARTDTRWWHALVFGRASAVLFLAGRPHFHRPDGSRAKGNSGGPIALVAYGDQDADVLQDRADCGIIAGRCFDLRQGDPA